MEGTRTQRQERIMERGKCRLCCRPHSLRHCHAFLAMTPAERYESARVHRYCINCLATSHTTGTCTSTGSCRHCGRAHHTLLHRPNIATATRNRRPTPPPTRHRRDDRRGRTRQRAIERPAARLQSRSANQRNLRKLVNQAKSTLDQLKELLHSSTSQARRHVEDMEEENLIEF
ncbi:uncharacterized protein [Eurosta solidaginis]|uniref:uncharacterized protein n=1 Tax=Eurosta solidaginis TaxID=178769 RepID=UPI0035313A8B